MMDKLGTDTPEYVYQYHWGRIIAVIGVVAVLAAAVVFGLIQIGDETGTAQLTATDNGDAEQATTDALPETSAPAAADNAPETASATAAIQAPATAPTNTLTAAETTTLTAAAGNELTVHGESTPSAPASQPPAVRPTQVQATPATVTQTPAIPEQAPETAALQAAGKAPEATALTKAELFTAAIKRAKLTTRVEQLEPGKDLPTAFKADPDNLAKVYFYTEVLGQAGKTHYHRWYHNGELAAKVPIAIGSDRWRCYSSKFLTHNQAGEWEVKVTDANGKLLAKSEFHFDAE